MNNMKKLLLLGVVTLVVSIKADTDTSTSLMKDFCTSHKNFFNTSLTTLRSCPFLRHTSGSLLLLTAFYLACETGRDVCYKWKEVKDRAFEVEAELLAQDTHQVLTEQQIKRLSLLQGMSESFKLFWREFLAIIGTAYLTSYGFKLIKGDPVQSFYCIHTYPHGYSHCRC